MKTRIISFLICAICALPMMAQTDNVIYAVVPTDMTLEDNIVVDNQTPYEILQVAVADVNQTLLGSAKMIDPADNATIREYDHNGLAALCGHTLAIKVKGRVSTAEDGSDIVSYDWQVTLMERHHDLHIIIRCTADQVRSFMDF